MTPEEAKTKWCPAYRLTLYGDPTHGGGAEDNRGNQNPPKEKTMCIADKCMAWRFRDDEWPEGYCGLAGRE